ncbi:MAG: hypothetical protein Q7R81_02105 [Candidatus Peregrinibacteria bacterium]|nr:hypothetical protein [Candidatus Peregrinibacteria bacterium]
MGVDAQPSAPGPSPALPQSTSEKPQFKLQHETVAAELKGLQENIKQNPSDLDAMNVGKSLDGLEGKIRENISAYDKLQQAEKNAHAAVKRQQEALLTEIGRVRAEQQKVRNAEKAKTNRVDKAFASTTGFLGPITSGISTTWKKWDVPGFFADLFDSTNRNIIQPMNSYAIQPLINWFHKQGESVAAIGKTILTAIAGMFTSIPGIGTFIDKALTVPPLVITLKSLFQFEGWNFIPKNNGKNIAAMSAIMQAIPPLPGLTGLKVENTFLNAVIAHAKNTAGAITANACDFDKLVGVATDLLQKVKTNQIPEWIKPFTAAPAVAPTAAPVVPQIVYVPMAQPVAAPAVAPVAPAAPVTVPSPPVAPAPGAPPLPPSPAPAPKT